MNIKQIIAEEARLMLLENDLVDSLEQLPEEELVAAIKKLIPLVTSGLPKYIAQEAPVAEGIKGALAKTLINLPGGRDLGAMYLAAIDRATPAAIRVAFLVALANLVSPVDLGTILSGGLLDMLGPLTALDDILLIRKVLQMMKSEGLPSERHHDKLDQLAGSDPRQLEEPANVDGQPEEPLNERKIRKSAIYKIIQEELEVVLTNEEAEEFFDLNMATLLDEMMSEEEEPEKKSKKREPRVSLRPRQIRPAWEYRHTPPKYLRRVAKPAPKPRDKLRLLKAPPQWLGKINK